MSPEQISRNYNSSIIGRRWAATWLDFLLFLGMFFGVAVLFSEKYAGLGVGIWATLVLLYYPLLEGLSGRTFGKWVCRLKVVDAQGAPPGILKASLRTLLRLIEVNPFLMGGLPAGIVVLTSPKRQRLGDMAANTYVLRSEDLIYLGMLPTAMPTYYGYGAQPPYAGPTYPGYSMTPPPPGLAIPPLPPTIPGAPSPWQTPTTPMMRAPLPSAKAPVWALPVALIATVFAVGLIGSGLSEIRKETNNRHPITMTCEQFLKSPPQNGWFHLTDCDIDVPGAAFFSLQSPYSSADASAITEIYLPVYSPKDIERKKTALLLTTSDEHIYKLVDEMNHLENADKKKISKWVEDHLDALDLHKDITGTIQTDFSIPDSTRREIARLKGDHLATNYVIIKEGALPMGEGSFFTIVVGCFFGFLAFAFWIVVLTGFSQRKSRPQSYGS